MLKRLLTIALLVAMCLACTTATAEDIYKKVADTVIPDMDVVLVMDTSGSMGDYNQRANKMILQYAKEAAEAFIQQTLVEEGSNRIALVTFNSNANKESNLTDVSQIAMIQRIIHNNLNPGGTTNIAAGFDLAAQLLDAQGRPEARQMIVLFSDGMHNMSGDPVVSGTNAAKGADGTPRDIYTIGMVGALDDVEKTAIRDVLDQPYAVRYIEIDGEKEMEGTFYMLSSVNTGALDAKYHILRVLGYTDAEVIHKATGERLSSITQEYAQPFGTLFVTTDGHEKIFLLNNDDYEFRVIGGKTGGAIDVSVEVLDNKAVQISQLGQWSYEGNPGTRLSYDVSFTANQSSEENLSFNPWDPNSIDPFTGEHEYLEIEPANGFLTVGSQKVRSAPYGEAKSIGTVGQGERYKDEFRVYWSEGNWYFIEYDLGTKDVRNGVKRGWVRAADVEIVDGWVAPAFSLDEKRVTLEAVDLVAMPYNFGKEITVVKSLKAKTDVTLMNIIRGDDRTLYGYIEIGKGDSRQRGYVPLSALSDAE